MTTPKNAVRVIIGGEEYTVKSELPPEYTREVAAYLDAALKRVRDSLPSVETHKAAILAALAITDELFQARRGDREIATRKNAYAKARSHRRVEDEASSVALYRACAAWLVWIAAKQDTAQLRRVWEGEKAFLRTAIDRSRYEDLDDFVQTVLEEDRTRNEQERDLS